MRHVLLHLGAFVQHLLQHGAGTIRIAHVEVGAGEIQLGVDRIVMQLAEIFFLYGSVRGFMTAALLRPPAWSPPHGCYPTQPHRNDGA